jgi:predicted RNA-binding protein with PUA-like domain
VDLKPLKPLARAVTLAEIKADPRLADIPLLRQSRLSVMPLSAAHFRAILSLV